MITSEGIDNAANAQIYRNLLLDDIERSRKTSLIGFSADVEDEIGIGYFTLNIEALTIVTIEDSSSSM